MSQVLEEPVVVKHEPMSEGLTTPRKKKPKLLAVTQDNCTGCAGSPACVPYCPVAECMYWVPDEEHPPFGRIEVDPFLCIGRNGEVVEGRIFGHPDGRRRVKWSAGEVRADKRYEEVYVPRAIAVMPLPDEEWARRYFGLPDHMR